MTHLFSFLKIAPVALLGAAMMASCSSNTASGTAIGAAIGGGLGALTDNSTEGQVVGAGIGAALGALVGNAADEAAMRRSQQVHPDYYAGDVGHAVPMRNPAPNFPWGRASTPGAAFSPYPPYREIDVRGYRRGELVVDPTTEGVFRVP